MTDSVLTHPDVPCRPANPADRRGVIGKLHEVAQQAVGTAISTAERELQDRVQQEVTRRVDDAITKQSGEAPLQATSAGGDRSLRCPSCGAVQKPSARFCKHCGAGVTSAGPSSGTKPRKCGLPPVRLPGGQGFEILRLMRVPF